MPRHWLRWLIAGLVVLAVLAVAGPFVYIHFLNGRAPGALTLSPSAGASATAQAGGPVAGAWTIGSGSVVGYRVNEVLFGQNATAVGRSSSVTGHLTIQGSTATAASFSVPMDTIRSDKSQRDAQFDGRIMDVARYPTPTGTFTLTSPVDLDPLPGTGVVRHYAAHGRLTLHGTTRPVTVSLTAERSASKTGGAQIQVAGQIPVLFSDYNIQNPSFAGVVTTQDHGLLEFRLVFTRS
jgi:polyisoprenoid-binding protein YceI